MDTSSALFRAPAAPALVATAILLAACGAGPAGQAEGGAAKGGTDVANPSPPLKVEVVAQGLNVPWGVAFLPDGAMLVTERDGGLQRVTPGAPQRPVTGLPAAYSDNQGGLLDVALHPGFAQNGLVYVSMAEGTRDANHTALYRGRLQGDALVEVARIFKASPDKRGGAHFGGRILFLPDGTLLLTLGDGYAYRDQAQKLDNDFGKIVRLTDTGQPAPGNPLAAQAGARAEIYSYGHRNVQGIARDPVSGAVYAHEHGPKGGDELNLLKPGANYGWPAITYGVDYSGAPISLKNAAPGMEQPLTYWVPSIAPSGMAFYTGEMFKAWKGDLFVSALAGSHLRRIDMENGAVRGQEVLLADRGERFRHVAQAPDGALIVLTDDADGKVLRITPGG